MIQALSQDKPGHVPYRESKLTRLLQVRAEETLKKSSVRAPDRRQLGSDGAELSHPFYVADSGLEFGGNGKYAKKFDGDGAAVRSMEKHTCSLLRTKVTREKSPLGASRRAIAITSFFPFVSPSTYIMQTSSSSLPPSMYVERDSRKAITGLVRVRGDRPTERPTYISTRPRRPTDQSSLAGEPTDRLAAVIRTYSSIGFDSKGQGTCIWDIHIVHVLQSEHWSSGILRST